MGITVDSVALVLSQPFVYGSLLVYLLYITPVWIARLLVITTCATTVLKYGNNRYKTRGRWEELGENDIAVVTGGSNGLGLEIVKLLIRKKVECVIIDKEEVSDAGLNSCPGVTFIQCDLDDDSKVLTTIKSINERVGTPTILVNNAAMRHSESLNQLSYEQMHTITRVNTIIPAIFMKEFLKTQGRLYTVNISSILGLVSPANLSFYSASKAALNSLHDSISHECGSDDKRFLLVTPGQLDTRMFRDVKPPKQYLAPVVHASVLAEKVVRCISKGERGTLYGPLYTYFIPILKLLPYGVGELARWFSEMDHSVVKQEDEMVSVL